MYFTVLLVARNGSYVIEYTGVHSVNTVYCPPPMYLTVLLVVRNGSYVIEYTGGHSVQAADTSLLFECNTLHSKP